MTGGMAEVVAAVNKALSQLSQWRSTTLAAVESARAAYAQAAAATSGTNRSEPGEALNSITAANTEAEKAVAQFTATETHLKAYLATLEGGSPSSSGSARQPTPHQPPDLADRPVSTLTTHGILHGTKQRREGATEGPVVFSAPDRGATRTEAGQAKEYIDAGNAANREGMLSPTGRVTLDLKAKKAKTKAASRERKRAQNAQEPYGSDVAAHLPDTTWVGQPEPPGGWGRHTNRLNASIGSQSAQYPVGYRPTLFQMDDTWPELPNDADVDP